MCVPSCFHEALDIKQTVRVIDGKKQLIWTQGSHFSFKQGDIIYDNPEAYQGAWSETINKIGFCVFVKSAIDAGPAEETGHQKY